MTLPAASPFVRLLIIMLGMIALLAGGWQWPRLIDWGGGQELHHALRASWLVCLCLIGSALSWWALRRPQDMALWTAWLALGMLTLADTASFRGLDVTGQVAILALWIAAVWQAESWCPRVVAGLGAAVHGWTGGAGAVAKAVNFGFDPETPEIMIRAFGETTTTMIMLPAMGAIVCAVWMVRRCG